MRVCCLAVATFFASCSPATPTCPAPVVNDWRAGVPTPLYPPGARVVIDAPSPEILACATVSVTGPDGDVPFEVIDGAVSFSGERSGRYVVAFTDGYRALVVIDAPETFATPCAVLPVACEQVSRAAHHFACDDRLVPTDGGAAITLDGGLWFAAASQLFAWHADELRHLRVENDGPVIDSVVASPRPRLWAADSSRLTTWNDGGVTWSLSPLAVTERLNPPRNVVGIARDEAGVFSITSDGEICLNGQCRRDVSVGRAFAMNDDTAWSTVPGPFTYDDLFRLSGIDGGSFVSTLFVASRSAGNLARRPLIRSVSGVRLTPNGAVFALERANRWSSTDDVVWLSNGESTAIFCE